MKKISLYDPDIAYAIFHPESKSPWKYEVVNAEGITLGYEGEDYIEKYNVTVKHKDVHGNPR